jgi:hypothetical protein
MADPNLFKRCGCRHPDTGRPLVGACPKLRRRGGAWNPDHGVWHYQIELPRKANGDRRQLRRGGFAHNKAAAAERDRARALLALAAGDPDVACEIADLLQAATKRGGPLPDPDTLRARLGGHLPVTDNPTVAAYLTGWLAARKLDENTLRGYESHIRVHLIPHLGRHRLTKLRARHIAAMFDAIEARNEQIRAAKTSDVPTVRKTVAGVRPTGPVTCQRIRDTLRNALNDAVPTLIPTNPAVEVELAQARPAKARPWTAERIARWQATGQKPSPVMFWLPQQTIEFLDYAAEHDPELYPLYRLIAYRGLRRGEACGLLDADATLDTPTGRGHLTTTNQTATLGHKTKQK